MNCFGTLRKKKEKNRQEKSFVSQIPPTLLDITADIAKRTEDQGLIEVELKKDKLQIKLDI